MVLSDLVERIMGEYIEVPDLRLEPPKAQRLWNLDAVSCTRLLDRLAGDAFLARTGEATVVRADRHPRRPAARALPPEPVAR